LDSSWALRWTWELLADISFIETLMPAMSLDISPDTEERLIQARLRTAFLHLFEPVW